MEESIGKSKLIFFDDDVYFVLLLLLLLLLLFTMNNFRIWNLAVEVSDFYRLCSTHFRELFSNLLYLLH